MFNAIAVTLHVLAAIIWVGGMFFAVYVLRLAAGALEPSDRLPLWHRSFTKFFPWVWMAVIVLPVTGYWLVFELHGNMASLPVPYHIMHGIGLIMVFIFLHLWFAPYARFKAALEGENLPEAAKQLNTMRLLVTTNLYLGLLNSVIGTTGRFWG
ncbi:MAG: hypothetical protein HOM07_21615 [Rhodospirillaceae bacterium]|jgi:uncharacterized membrane protein|nr:hypothetical protein [Rhodospirillaceae bacterium]MBT5455886.1 hypothetical protein [Rhodospirillaceae bacterium]